MSKDYILSSMVKNGYNVAKYCSISSKTGGLKVVHGVQYDEGDSKIDVIDRLIIASNNKSVNVRSFSKESVSGNRFVMGLSSVQDVLNVVDQNTKDGLDSIVNENIDIMDHGVSGVILGDIVEFSPYDTPRCVEKDGTCRLGLEMGIEILESVYGLNLLF